MSQKSVYRLPPALLTNAITREHTNVRDLYQKLRVVCQGHFQIFIIFEVLYYFCTVYQKCVDVFCDSFLILSAKPSCSDEAFKMLPFLWQPLKFCLQTILPPAYGNIRSRLAESQPRIIGNFDPEWTLGRILVCLLLRGHMFNLQYFIDILRKPLF